MEQDALALRPLEPNDLSAFRHGMQEAFQQGAEAHLGEGQGQVLPEADIDASLGNPGSTAYQAWLGGRPAGGAIVCLSDEGRVGHLDFLFVRVGMQGHGIGQRIWQAIEARHPQVGLWETCTPYFDRRNVHFYINVLGFAAVEYFNPHHPDPSDPQGCAHDEGMFRFEKRMR